MTLPPGQDATSRESPPRPPFEAGIEAIDPTFASTSLFLKRLDSVKGLLEPGHHRLGLFQRKIAVRHRNLEYQTLKPLFEPLPYSKRFRFGTGDRLGLPPTFY